MAGATLAAPLTQSCGAVAAAPNKKMRVGAMCVGAGSFWGLWADILSKKGTLGTSFLNMEVTHCWDVNTEAAKTFAEKWDCKAVGKYDAMIGEVDAIVSGAFYEVPWQHRLLGPYIRAGVPTYVSRPFSYRLRDIDDMLDAAAKHGTPLIATSVGEHLYEASYLKGRLANLGTLKSVHGLCNSTEYAGHFHIQWFILRALGYDVDKISLLTDDDRKLTYLQETMLFKGGGEQPPFLATLHANTNVPYFHVTARGEKGSQVVHADRSPDRTETLYHYFAKQLFDMQTTFEGRNYQPFDVIRKKTQFFLAGYYSHLEKNGALIPVDSEPVNWSPHHFKPDYVDESIFRGT